MMNRCEVCGKDTINYIDSYSERTGRKIVKYVCPVHQDMLNDAMQAEIERIRREI